MDKQLLLTRIKQKGEPSSFAMAPTDAAPDDAPRGGTGSYAEAIASNDSVVGNQLSRALYDQTDNGPYEALTKRAGVNKYLEKIAYKMPKFPMKDLVSMKSAVSNSSPLAKASLGLSAAGLGLSLANYHNGKITAKSNMDKAQLERKSLSALNNINKTLSTATIAPASMASPKPAALKHN